METIKYIKSRISVRKYLDRPVPVEIIRELADCGRMAPSGYNRQPWVFIAVTDSKIKEKIADRCRYGKFIKQAGACIALFCSDSECKLEDACAATENMIIAAQAYGLGTCWVNSYRKEHSGAIEKLLNCPSDYELVVLLAVGYPDEQRQTPKKPLEQVLKWQSF